MTKVRTQRTAELDAIVLGQIKRWRDLGEVWTADVAKAVGEPSQKVRLSLERLERYGAVVRVAKGSPSSWACRQ
jgi:chromosome condensin MukBEF MukE localization factor